jgi:hypothetical protein
VLGGDSIDSVKPRTKRARTSVSGEPKTSPKRPLPANVAVAAGADTYPPYAMNRENGPAIRGIWKNLRETRIALGIEERHPVYNLERMTAFADAAALYFANVPATGRAGDAAYNAYYGTSVDVNLVLDMISDLAFHFYCPTASSVRLMREVRRWRSPLDAQGSEAALMMGVDLVVEFATTALAIEDRGPRRTLALALIVALERHAHAGVGHLATMAQAPAILEMLERYDPSPKGKRGRRSAASILAGILLLAGLRKGQTEVQVRRQIEAAVARQRSRAERESG